MKQPILGQEEQRTCSRAKCQKTNPQWHSFIHKHYTFSSDDLGWRCHLCDTFYRTMSYFDYKQQLKQKP